MTKKADGRTARRDRNSEAVLDTVHEMFVEGNFAPSVEEVAVRSGVSLRSVYRYFQDTDDLLQRAIARRVELVGDLYALDRLGEGTRAERVQALVDQRLQLHAKLAPTIRAAMLRASESPRIAAQVSNRRELLADQVVAHFEPELGRLDRARRAEVASCVDALCSFESLELLRVRSGLSPSRARRALVSGVTALLSQVDGTD
ncbi:TetR/AcrR family transcriptional regulator [Nocardioides sp.]|uniref:TetR/AcrR family transcriptional regulator n=1 Tax=Nocardioides sp. TaxID=35761 RepID=UPI00378433D4